MSRKILCVHKKNKQLFAQFARSVIRKENIVLHTRDYQKTITVI